MVEASELLLFRVREFGGSLKGLLRRLGHLVIPFLMELSCHPIKAPHYIMLNNTCTPHWFRNVHTVMADSRLVPAVSFNSSVSELPDVAVRDF